jgi:cytoskeletal protein CcmA (bactofilin family)
MNGRKTLVEEGTQFKGSLVSDCPIEVKGRVEGDLTAPSLTVSTSGAVHGKVKVGEMKSQGELAGEFDADVVQLSGTVKDSTVIRARSLEVKLAPASGKMQVIFGECELEVGSEQPVREQAKDKTPSVRPPMPPPASTEPMNPVVETNGSPSVRPPNPAGPAGSGA